MLQTQIRPPGFPPDQNNQNQSIKQEVKSNQNPGTFQSKSWKKYRTVPPPENHDFIFIEIPKPKAKKIVQGPISLDPNSYQPKLPYPERIKVREKDKPSAQQSRFMKLFKQLRLEIGLKYALIEMPKFNKCPEKLEDLGKFLIPCALQELDRTNALADFGASINLLPHSIYKQLGLGALKPTRMTLELANHSVTHPIGIAEDVVGDLSFAPQKLSLIYFSTEENIPILRESEETSRNDSKNDLPSCNDFSSIKVPSDDSVTFSNPFFEFDVNFNNPLFDEELEDIEDDIEFLLHDDPSTPLKSVASILEGFINDPPFKENEFDLKCKTNDEAECFNPGGDNDEIDAFLAIEVRTYNEGYYDLEGDITYLESLLSDDTTHNLSSKMFFDHEPQQLRNEPENEPLITFSPKSDPLHHEFTGEIITISPGIVREHEDYINRMSLLCSNSSSQSPENFHTIIESLPTSTTLIENSIESDFDSEEDIIDNLPNENPTHERLTFNIKPDAPVINNVDELNEDECFDPGGGEINVEVDNSFTFVTWTFLPFLTYPEVSPLLSSTKNEDTIYDPGIST
ncbi:reverse transcriptase domain-containing protein [Tanacetum coccineum]